MPACDGGIISPDTGIAPRNARARKRRYDLREPNSPRGNHSENRRR